MWRLITLGVPDRAGNSGFSFYDRYSDNGSGQVCNRMGACLTAPTVVVTSTGDASPPALQTVNIQQTNQQDVTTTLGFLDNLSGVSSVRVTYQSATSTQFQECFASLNGGTTTNGTWRCTITFSSLSALGQWNLGVQVWDVAGNVRTYTRRQSDGFLCYNDPGQAQVCQNFGTTSIIHLQS